VWAEPGEVALLNPSGRVSARTVNDSWFADRPRPLLLGLGSVVIAFALGVVVVGKPEMGLAALGCLAIVVAVLLRPVVGGLVLVGVVPILSGVAPGVPVAHFRISELLIGVVGVTVLVSARRSDAVPWSSLDWLLLAYGAGWAAFGTIDAITLHQNPSLTDWGTIFGQLQFFLIYRAVRTSLRTPAERRGAVGVLLVATTPVALLAVLQQLHVGPVVTFLNTLTGGLAGPALTAGTATRATGPFNNWAVLAGYLLPLLLVLFALTLSGQIARHRRGAWVVGLVAFTALLLTSELSAILLLAIGVVVLAAQYGYGRRALRFAGAAVVVGALVAAPFLATRLNQEFSSSAGSGRHAGVPQTLDFRWQVWTTQYVPAIESRPLGGYGAQLPASIQWRYPESQYIAYLMEGGFPVLALFAGLALAMLKRSREAARARDPFDQAVGRAVAYAVIAMLVMNLIWPFLSNAGLPQVLWCLLAIAVPRLDNRGAVAAPDLAPATLAVTGGVL
jgi:hypothetical protein